MNINLTNSHLTFEIDDEDYEKISKYKWRLGTRNHIQSTVWENGKAVAYSVADIIFGTKRMYDHIDRNPLNNRKNNLRPCNRQQNSANRKRFSNNTSGYKGVSFLKNNNKWRVQITFKNKKLYFGLFNSAKEAALIYNLKAKELFGEFAVLNTF